MTPLETTIAIRAYTERPNTIAVATKSPKQVAAASAWTLIFDCETTIDEFQRLRVGFYQIRRDYQLSEEGLFYDPDEITPTELDVLRDYAEDQYLRCIEASEFRTKILIRYGYTRCGTVVGFNLPFDISRIAIDHGPARGHMRGGFSFVLSRDRRDPRIRVKHLSPRAALIDFAPPWEQETTRGMRRRKLKTARFGGHFVDIKTLAAALLSRRFTLRSLAEFLKTPTQKLETDEHGRITEDYLDYARADVQTTWECYRALTVRYAEHELDQPADRILSEASIGKAYLQKMGIKPMLHCNPGFPRELFGQIFCPYYGGRAEIRNRRVILEVLYCDFKSMYPTVNSLMGLWSFVIAQAMSWRDTTESTQEFLDTISTMDLQNPATWKKLRTLVKLKPESDVLPVRAKYDGKTYTIGLNYLTTGSPLWYTLADCIVSKLQTGRAPKIEQALTFEPGPPQGDLQPVDILGREDYGIDPYKDDLFTGLIDLRDKAKSENDEIEKTLKIIANSTSYGIFIEVNRDDAPKSEELAVFGPDGESFVTGTKAVEEPGKYFHPLLGVLITGAARLMLGLAEKVASDNGLDWAFCDTDSIAMVRPRGLARSEFHRRATVVVDWFKPLNPYRKPESILKFEDQNFSIDSKKRRPLYCFAISAKRYGLFNLDRNGRPILRKASAHGLGHLLEPYSGEEAPLDLPTPQVPLGQLGVKRWQHDFWIKIIQAALDGHPDQVPLNWHPTLSRPAASRYSASSPPLLRWLEKWNFGKPYHCQIRPFGFLLSYSARTGIFSPSTSVEIVDEVNRGRPAKDRGTKPIAPFNSDPAEALIEMFDRETGEAVDAEQLKRYADVLAQYHLSPESKFENGRHLDSGRTERRYVFATGSVLIGKEANRVGESGEAHPHLSKVADLYRGGPSGPELVPKISD